MDVQPEASRPHIPDYGLPTTTDGLLDWSHVVERLTRSRHYWIGTSRAGTPHVVPVWGVVVDGILHFGGGPRTRWALTLKENPRVAVHLEDGEQAVILEGTVSPITDAADPRMERIDDAYEVKYDMRHGPTVWVVQPTLALAWTDFTKDATRWRFGEKS